jgi:hypothetical protein
MTDKQVTDAVERWIVVNIGCIECGVGSAIVGVFDDETRADALANELDKTHAWRQGGQNHFEVFPMPPLNEVAAEYLTQHKETSK